jgi:hypothetical protein
MQHQIRTSPKLPVCSNTQGTPCAILRMPLSDLVFDAAFTPRVGLSKEHVHQLARGLCNSGDLHPITVWVDPATGKFVILDGRHRVAAYLFQKFADIPARVFQGDRKAALLEAAKDNAKATYSWTTSECTQYAWGLVIAAAGSKRKIAQFANVRTSTVGNMRKRLADMMSAGRIPTGNWWRDRNDKSAAAMPEVEDDAARKVRIDKLRDYLNGTEMRFKMEFGRKPTMEELGVAMRWHLGQPRFKAMLSGGYTADEDEFSDHSEAHPLAAPPAQPDEDF